MLTIYKQKTKPPFPYDRKLSYSQYSSFKYSPEKWYRSYVLGEYDEPSKELKFGSMVDKRLQTDVTYLPEVPRAEISQLELDDIYEGIPLIGYPDWVSIESVEKILRDTKTGRNKWDKTRADQTEQLTMYLFLIWRKYGIKPEEFKCFIDWLPTKLVKGEVCFVEPFSVVSFETKRTMSDILVFVDNLLETRKKMVEYYNNHI